jgi:hypothetical protein
MNDGEKLISKAVRTRPMVMLSKRQLREKIEDAIGVLKATNIPKPTIFRRESVLVRLLSNGVAPALEALDPDSLLGELASAADWFKLNAKGEEVAADPPANVARVLLKSRDADFPIIEGICDAPFFSRDGKLIATPGYHSAEREYLAPAGFDLPRVPEHPSAVEVGRARALLLEDLLYDFPFADDASRAHAVGLLILPFVRRMIDGSTPIDAIDAPTEGTGKGLLATICVVPALGRELESMSEVREEDERRKRITSLLLACRPYGFFDNISSRVEGSSLASALTARTWADRVLGQSKMVRLPVTLTWIVTGNSLRFSGELARRTVYIRLDAKVERPYLRDSFRHQLPSWAIEHRAELVWAALIMIQNWIACGRPHGRATLGSFEDWARTIGGILEAAGLSGFLANQTNFYEQAGAEAELWSAFIEAAAEEFGDEAATVATLFQLAAAMLPEVLGDKSERSQHIRLGRALESRRDRIYGRYRILAARTHDEKGRRVPGYQFLPVDGVCSRNQKHRKHPEHRDIGENQQNLPSSGYPEVPDVARDSPAHTNGTASPDGSLGREKFHV